MASGSSLNTVVSSLVRASMGAAVAPTVTDDELERHVAALIVKEAKAKAEIYAKDGIRAYLPHTGLPENNLPKANKRFINSLVKNVSDHNKVILQAQAESAEQIKEKRRQEEARDRRQRAEEAADDHRRVQRLMGQGRGDSRSWREGRHDRDRDRESERSRRRSRSRSPRRRATSPRRSQSPRHRSRSPRRNSSPRRSHKSSRREERRDDHKRRRREDSPRRDDDGSSRRHSEHRHSSKRSTKDRSDKEIVRSVKGKGKELPDSDHTDRDDSPYSSKPEQQTSSNDLTSRSPSPEYSADPTPSYSSKMDKYFSSTYDPRLDVAQPSVNKSGLLEGPQWDGWEGMLELVQLRAADREEKKRREKEDKERSKFDKKRAKARGSTSIISPAVSVPPISDVGLMDMKYKKRGATKEWDLAKETPT